MITKIIDKKIIDMKIIDKKIIDKKIIPNLFYALFLNYANRRV